MNYLAKARTAGKLKEYILGTAGYQIQLGPHAIMYDEPQQCDTGIASEIWPALSDDVTGKFLSEWMEALVVTLKNKSPDFREIYCVSSWVYALLREAQNHKESALSDRVKQSIIDSTIAEKIQYILDTQGEKIRKVKKWAGAEWNSTDGLYTPLNNTIKAVYDLLA